MSRADEQARKDRNARLWEDRRQRADAWRAAHRDDAPSIEPTEETCSRCSYCEPRKNLHCPKCCALGFPF